MYLVKIYDGPSDNEGIVIANPFVSDIKLPNCEINLEMEAVSNMNFRINPASPAWNKIRPMQTLIRVFRHNGKKVFDGRMLAPKQAMSSGGMFTVEYTCEDRRAYLQDTRQRHGEYHDITVRDFVGVILDNHNRQSEPHKRFKLGNVTVTNPTDNVYRYLGYETTFDTLKDKLIDRLGGYLVIRDEVDGMYLDYLASVGEVKQTPIRLAFNMQDLKKQVDVTQVVTRLVPLGARIESEDEMATDASQARITIADVNSGKDYIDDNALIAEFGIIEGTLQLDDVNDKGVLLTRGKQFFTAQKAAIVSYDATAVNVDLLDESVEPFELGNYYPIENEVLAIDEPVQIIGMKIDINQPHKFGLKIGDKFRTLSQYQAQANKKMKEIGELENRVGRLSTSNAQLKQSLSTAKDELQDIQDSLLNADLEGLPEELRGISEQLIGIQLILDNLVIPEYGLANSTEAGLMSPADKKKSDLLILNKLVDLDDLVSRVGALENPPEPPVEEGGV